MELTARLATFGRWLLLGALSGVVCGMGSAGFLWLLDRATSFRMGHPSIVYALPFAGLAVGALIERFGRPIRAGSDLVIDTIHDNGREIPLRMGPMVLLGTVLSHLFGGSAGREGTAVQMGASLTDWISHRLRVGKRLRRQLLMAGVAGGFGSVFGTPLAGAIFGLEFIVVGRIAYDAIIPALVASFVGDLTTRSLGIAHAHYPTLANVSLTPLLFTKWLVFGLAIAAMTTAFIALTHLVQARSQRHLTRLPIRMFVGGACVVVLWKIVGTNDYLGLGLPLSLRAFHDSSLPAYAFALKLLFTAVTLGSGFLGGEVTPLFVMGATLGSVLARVLGIPIELGAGVGMAAAFAAASNTPLALSIMAVEVLGAGVFPHVAIVCALAFFVTRRRSIYRAQRMPLWDEATREKKLIPLRDLPAATRAPPPSD